MTVVVVILDPPETALSALTETAPLSGTEAADLYRAMVQDACRAVADSGGELLVNYPPEGGEATAREIVAAADRDPEAVRFEVQAGSSYEAQVGNAVTHLLEDEDATSVAVLDPTAPLVSRSLLDGAAMKLRSRGAVLGPDADGGVYYAAFCEPIDFAGAYAAPAVETLAGRAAEAGLSVDFLAQHTGVETGADLRRLLAVLGARRVAERAVPARTVACLDRLGLRVEGERLLRDGTDSS
jgi:2-phospho-L-lactate guanylyltransferase (CobY/MobA/RfbA family)